jgi:hypothetical protein
VVAEIPSERWDLAIQQLEDGGPTVTLDADVPAGRNAGSDSRGRWRSRVYVWTETAPSKLTEVVSADVQEALATLRPAMDADAACAH